MSKALNIVVYLKNEENRRQKDRTEKGTPHD